MGSHLAAGFQNLGTLALVRQVGQVLWTTAAKPRSSQFTAVSIAQGFPIYLSRDQIPNPQKAHIISHLGNVQLQSWSRLDMLSLFLFPHRFL